jgi:hypothetical protein
MKELIDVALLIAWGSSHENFFLKEFDALALLRRSHLLPPALEMINPRLFAKGLEVARQ